MIGWPSSSGMTGLILGKRRSNVRVKAMIDSYCSGRNS